MVCFFIRHGQTDWNLKGKIQGWQNTLLNDTGRAQATEAAERIAEYGITRIISSDLKRAAETAEIIGARINICVEYDARLREYNFGKLVGREKGKIKKTALFWILMAKLHKKGLETPSQFFRRIKDFMDNLNYDQNTLIVTHSLVLYCAMCWAENKGKFEIRKLIHTCLHNDINNATILRIDNVKSRVEDISLSR